MNIQIKEPFYAKAVLIFAGMFLFAYTMYLGKHIIVPVLYATLIAILLNPIVNFLVEKKFSEIFAIFIAVLLAILVILSFFYLISSQLTVLSETYPQLQEKF